jgi:hypothetical protein
MAVKASMLVFWVVMRCGLLGRYCNRPFYFCLPGTKEGVNFSGWYLRVWLRSSGRTRTGLKEYPGGISVKGTYGPAPGTKTTLSLLSLWQFHFIYSISFTSHDLRKHLIVMMLISM